MTLLVTDMILAASGWNDEQGNHTDGEKALIGRFMKQLDRFIDKDVRARHKLTARLKRNKLYTAVQRMESETEEIEIMDLDHCTVPHNDREFEQF